MPKIFPVVFAKSSQRCQRPWWRPSSLRIDTAASRVPFAKPSKVILDTFDHICADSSSLSLMLHEGPNIARMRSSVSSGFRPTHAVHLALDHPCPRRLFHEVQKSGVEVIHRTPPYHPESRPERWCSELSHRLPRSRPTYSAQTLPVAGRISAAGLRQRQVLRPQHTLMYNLRNRNALAKDGSFSILITVPLLFDDLGVEIFEL